MRTTLILCLCGLALAAAACSRHDEATVNAAGDKVAAQVKAAARDVQHDPDVQRASAEVKKAAHQAGAAIKSSAHEARDAAKGDGHRKRD